MSDPQLWLLNPCPTPQSSALCDGKDLEPTEAAAGILQEQSLEVWQLCRDSDFFSADSLY